MSRANADGNNSAMKKKLLRQGLEVPALAIIVFAGDGRAGPPRRADSVLAGTWSGRVIGTSRGGHGGGPAAFGIATLQQRYCFAREDGKRNLIMQAITTGVQLIILVTMFVFFRLSMPLSSWRLLRLLPTLLERWCGWWWLLASSAVLAWGRLTDCGPSSLWPRSLLRFRHTSSLMGSTLRVMVRGSVTLAVP
ncbi:hypothetical protein JCM18909_3285 [Cutibacterium acnes JCM 18909]|nr:hypothetical protein JCM18909_3285 [Cutibacterium acnes JCM 18909]